ncbi:hypothetical protein [Tropicimonas sp. IMCC34043]|uniref:hypothetical protein n=1 Tax=Tropicimonas sp. IMCC34043 TaxID=2248760 RepID=UPI000E27AE45|nr:hypothetical protein [Tropicimonas sp. IMCC34043]
MLELPRDLIQPDPSQPAGDPASIMAQLAGSDPRLAMLMQLLQSGRAREGAAPEPVDDRTETIVDLSERLEAAEAQILRLKTSGRRLLERARASEERLSELAAALGACGLCWGEDPGCPSCRGRGRPGMTRPDPDLRQQLFGPQRSRAGRSDEPAAH